MEETNMRVTGNIRRIDDLGRIVIPKEIRRAVFGTSDATGESMEFYYEKDGTIILKPYKVPYKVKED